MLCAPGLRLMSTIFLRKLYEQNCRHVYDMGIALVEEIKEALVDTL